MSNRPKIKRPVHSAAHYQSGWPKTLLCISPSEEQFAFLLFGLRLARSLFKDGGGSVTCREISPGKSLSIKLFFIQLSRCADGIIDSQEPSIREQIPSGLLADKGGVAQIRNDQQKLDDLNKELRSFLDGPMNSGATKRNRTMSAAGAKENRSCATGEVGESEAGLIRKKESADDDRRFGFAIGTRD